MKRRQLMNPAVQGDPRRRGAMMIFIAVFLFVFLGIIAFSVDIAYMHLSRTELRTASDAAARAAGESLSRTQSVPLAKAAAISIANQNTVDGDPLILEDSDIITGNSAKQANGKWQFTAGATPINGFRVTGRKLNSSPSGSVKLYFARIFGKQDYELTASAASVRTDRDIALVLDRSTSMKLWVSEPNGGMWYDDWRFCVGAQPGSRWEALEGAVGVFLTELNNSSQNEYIGLASYGSSGTWCDHTNLMSQVNHQLSSNTSGISSAVSAIGNSKFNGNTAIGEGMRRGIDLLNNQTYARPFAKKTMVLMTDGVHNTGATPQTVASECVANNIVVYTVTFGDGADQTAMQYVANTTGGKHYHAPDQAGLVAAFKEIAQSLSVIITE